MSKWKMNGNEVDAFLWAGDQNQTEDPEWIVDEIKKGNVYFRNIEGKPYMYIDLKGIKTRAEQGQYIVKLCEEIIVPYPKEVFEAHYRRV